LAVIRGATGDAHEHHRAEVLVAFTGFSAAGLVANADDRHLVSQAQRHLAEGNG
jgi:hypothetical protein